MHSHRATLGIGLGLVLIVQNVVGVVQDGALGSSREVGWIVLGALMLLCWSVGTWCLVAKPQAAAGGFGGALLLSTVIGFHRESFWAWPFLSAMMVFLADQSLLLSITTRTRRRRSARYPIPPEGDGDREVDVIDESTPAAFTVIIRQERHRTKYRSFSSLDQAEAWAIAASGEDDLRAISAEVWAGTHHRHPPDAAPLGYFEFGERIDPYSGLPWGDDPSTRVNPY